VGVADEENDLSEVEQDAEDVDVSNNFSEVDLLGMRDTGPILDLLPDDNDRRGTFTFTVNEDQHDREVADIPATNDLSVVTSESQFEQDATITELFRSPTHEHATPEPPQPTEDVQYPELPQSPGEDDIIEASEEEQLATLQSAGIVADNVAGALAVVPVLSEDVLPEQEQEQSTAQREEMEVFHEVELTTENTSVELAEVSYPSLPADVPFQGSIKVLGSSQHQDVTETETCFDALEPSPEDCDRDMDLYDDSQEEEFTEASLQLNIQRELKLGMQAQQVGAQGVVEEQQTSIFENASGSEDMEMSEHVDSPLVDAKDDEIVEPHTNVSENNDIAAGLTLGFSAPPSGEPTPHKLRSPSPPLAEQGLDDATMTIALDDDTAILKDFLSRAAASKASKPTTTARRESVQNRRDSDVIRHALASPRKVLEEKDPNSPSKYDNEVTLDLSQTLTLTPDLQVPISPVQEQEEVEGGDDFKASRSRRSSRTRKSRLPAPSSLQPAGPPKIAVRRADGGEPIVLKKSDAQELSLLTRANTRKNKQGYVAVNVRLLKLVNDAASRSEDSTMEAVQLPGKKHVRWDEQLAYYQEGTDTMANMLAEAESLATPDELSLPVPSFAKSKPKVPKDKNSTPKIRRVRGLGTANGTPGKGLLQPGSLLPEAVQEEKEAAQAQPQRLPKHKSSKLKNMPVASTSATTSSLPPIAASSYAAPAESRLPTLDVAPVGVEPIHPHMTTIKERKSRLATPKKVKLPQPSSTVLGEGKENQQRTGIAAATPKKGIPMPSGIVLPGTVGGSETGLPRRRARKL
jgi:hypothetical protein